jgi:hypothetical protein
MVTLPVTLCMMRNIRWCIIHMGGSKSAAKPCQEDKPVSQKLPVVKDYGT